MRCEDADRHFDDYIDETLHADVSDALELHLLTCGRCAGMLRQLQGISRDATELADTIEPDSDLWPEIKIRLGAPAVDLGSGRRHATRISPLGYALATAAVIAIVIGAGVIRNVQSPTTTIPAPVEVSEAEREYQKAKSELLIALDARAESLAPETLATVRENLVIIESALADIQYALSENPDDPVLEQMLYAAYQYEVNLLHLAVRLANNS